MQTLRVLPKPTRRIRIETRRASHLAEKEKYKIVVVGAGSGGLTVASQIYDRFKAAGRPLNEGDIAIVDGAQYHYYQPGWTLVGAGLKKKEDTRKPLASLVPRHTAHIAEHVASFAPETSRITTGSGREITYEHLVVAAGLETNWGAIEGLPAALENPRSGVSSIFAYETCDKVWRDIEGLAAGRAVFTQPSGVIKCAGAPQKIMWMAWDRLRRTGRSGTTSVSFYTALPQMFGVPKYARALDALRESRKVPGYFAHDLVAVNPAHRVATFTHEGKKVDVPYDILHVTPRMRPLRAIKDSSLADADGWVAVDAKTCRSPRFDNVWAIGDCAGFPTGKTAAAVIAEAPVLAENLFQVVDTGRVGTAEYDGYTSCPLLTGYGELLLAEFKYGPEPKETFAGIPFIGNQAKPNRFFYHLKKDFFPWAYWNHTLSGKWFGTKGPFRPRYDAPSAPK